MNIVGATDRQYTSQGLGPYRFTSVRHLPGRYAVQPQRNTVPEARRQSMGTRPSVSSTAVTVGADGCAVLRGGLGDEVARFKGAPVGGLDSDAVVIPAPVRWCRAGGRGSLRRDAGGGRAVGNPRPSSFGQGRSVPDRCWRLALVAQSLGVAATGGGD